MILDDIMTYKRQELGQQQQRVTLAELKDRCADRSPALPLAFALSGQGTSLIAEVKKASPSKGVFCPDFDPVDLAKTYVSHGAAAVSVLTDNRFFHGSLEYLTQIKQAISRLPSPVPILRKDFIFDAYQVYEAYAYGADALLLIVTVLTDRMLDELLAQTRDLGMTALVEVHDELELARALRLQPGVVGVNNRNLSDFSVDLNTFGHLRPLIPDNVVAVAESGVRTAADVRRLADMGADAVLVGEALVTAHDVGAAVHELVRAGRSPTAERSVQTRSWAP